MSDANNKNQGELEKQCPESTKEERYRFLETGNDRLALKKLRLHLEWRNRYHLDDETKPDASPSTSTTTNDENSDATNTIISDDERRWNTAAIAAMMESSDYKNSEYPKLPRLARFDDVAGNDKMLGKDGNRIVQIFPGKLDPALGSEATYALATAFYLDRSLSRSSTEQVIVCVDVRGGDGWTNPPVMSILSFIKGLVGTTDLHFPERLALCIAYPMNFTGNTIWRMIRPFLDPKTASKIAILRGPGCRDSPIPYDEMVQFIEKDVLDQMEENRLSTIVEEVKE